jgi:hypothetical protein
MKKILCLVLSLALLLAVIPAASADEVTTPADDPVISEIVVSSSLTFSGTTANCYGTVTDLDKYIVATMTLSQGGTVVGSWSGSGTSVVNLSGSCKVTKGKTYSLVISGTVDGVSFTTTPIVKTC